MNVSQFSIDRITAGAKLYVYQSGTTTLASFYIDADGTSTGSNPQTADGAGLFAPIYLDPSILYRIKVTDSAGSTTLYDIDPVRVLDEGTADGVLMVRSRDAAAKRRISATVNEVFCASYSTKGDRGQALYARVSSLPSHAGKFTSADGAYWELSENLLNPFMFGAKGDNSTNDSPAIQAMFDFMVTKARPYPFNFMGAKYYVHDKITLPTIAIFLSIDINGGGATLRTDQAITIFERLATSEANAAAVIASCHYDIHHFEFLGSGAVGQIGLHIAASYTNLVRNCSFSTLQYGSIGTFCLASAWRDNLYHFCTKRALVLQSGVGYDSGMIWSDATTSTAPCNVSVIENCRVLGTATQISAFGIFGSDAVRMNGCISEGAGAMYDVHFDFQGSTTVKNFHVHMFHCEANSKVNFKVRSSGLVKIDGLVLSVPAAIYDARGSINCEIILKDISWANPAAPGTDPNNPNGRWFYHGDGGGYAGTESGAGGGIQWQFENWPANYYLNLKNPAHWENNTVPPLMHVRGMYVDGMMEWATYGSTFMTPIRFQDGSSINGMQQGLVTLATTTLAANAEVTETFTVTGLIGMKDVVVVNPYPGFFPPAGLAWNAWVHNDNTLKIRLFNTTGSAISLPLGIGGGGMLWRFSAPRIG